MMTDITEQAEDGTPKGKAKGGKALAASAPQNKERLRQLKQRLQRKHLQLCQRFPTVLQIRP